MEYSCSLPLCLELVVNVPHSIHVAVKKWSLSDTIFSPTVMSCLFNYIFIYIMTTLWFSSCISCEQFIRYTSHWGANLSSMAVIVRLWHKLDTNVGIPGKKVSQLRISNVHMNVGHCLDHWYGKSSPVWVVVSQGGWPCVVQERYMSMPWKGSQ